jgi:flavorubredoxin
MNILKILGVILAIIVVAGVIVWGISYYNSTSSNTLNPNSNVTGTALIVYDPGLSGAPKNVATKMANELQQKGYEVKLAGIRSNDAVNVTGYNVILVGGPTYAGDASSVVKTYLEGLNIPQNVTVGVFSVGSGADDQDSNMIMQQILQNKNVTVKVSVKFDNNSVQNDYSKYISQLLT